MGIEFKTSNAHVVIGGGAEVRISGPLYKRTFVYLLLLEELCIQYTISYTNPNMGQISTLAGSGGGTHTHTHTHTWPAVRVCVCVCAPPPPNGVWRRQTPLGGEGGGGDGDEAHTHTHTARLTAFGTAKSR